MKMAEVMASGYPFKHKTGMVKISHSERNATKVLLLHFSTKQRFLDYITLNLSFVGYMGYYTFLVIKLLKDFYIISKTEIL